MVGRKGTWAPYSHVHHYHAQEDVNCDGGGGDNIDEMWCNFELMLCMSISCSIHCTIHWTLLTVLNIHCTGCSIYIEYCTGYSMLSMSILRSWMADVRPCQANDILHNVRCTILHNIAQNPIAHCLLHTIRILHTLVYTTHCRLLAACTPEMTDFSLLAIEFCTKVENQHIWYLAPCTLNSLRTDAAFWRKEKMQTTIFDSFEQLGINGHHNFSWFIAVPLF